MLKFVSGPVTVTGYRPVVDRQSKQAKTWKDGTAKELVQFQVEGESRYREIMLHSSVNGQRAGVGDLVTLGLPTIVWEDATNGRDGRPYIRRTVLESVTAFAAVKA